jgi:hypothetical protein
MKKESRKQLYHHLSLKQTNNRIKIINKNSRNAHDNIRRHQAYLEVGDVGARARHEDELSGAFFERGGRRIVHGLQQLHDGEMLFAQTYAVNNK